MPTVPETFRELARLLERERYPFVIVGGLAAGLQGEPRFTRDVDVMITLRASRIPDLARAARAFGFDVDPDLAETQMIASGFFRMWHGSGDDRVAIDIMAGNSEYMREVSWRAEHMRFCGLEVLVASPEDIVLLKLVAWREKDIPDLRAIASRHEGRLDEGYLRKWAERFRAKNADLAKIPSRLQTILEGGPIPSDDPPEHAPRG